MEKNFKNLIDTTVEEIKTSAKSGDELCFMVGGVAENNEEGLKIDATCLLAGNLRLTCRMVADAVIQSEKAKLALITALALAVNDGVPNIPIKEDFVAMVHEALNHDNEVKE